jgi:hypothetical protein
VVLPARLVERQAVSLEVMEMANYGIEYADHTRGPGAGGPDVRAIRDSLKGATCGRCRRRPATIARGVNGHFASRCAICIGDEARGERLARARAGR